MKFWIEYIKKILFIAKLKTKLIYIIILSIFSSLLDIFSLGIIIPIVNISSDKESYINNISDNNWINFFFKIENLFILFGLLFIIKTLFSIGIYRYISKIRLNLQSQLRILLLKKYQKLDYSIFIKRQSSDYIQNITAVVASYSNVLMGVLRIISEFIIILAVLIYLFYLDKATITTLVPIFVIIVFLYQMLFRKKVIRIGKKINADSKFMIQTIKDSIMGMKEIRVSNKEFFFLKTYEENAKNIAKNSLIFEVILFSPRYIIELILIIIIIIYFFLNNFNIYQDSLTQTSILVASYSYAAFRLIPSFSLISRLISIMNNGIVYTDILYNDVKSSDAQNKISIANKINSEKDLKFFDLELKNIFFKYENDLNLLENINLKVNSGNSVLISGPSGSGKTTLVDIILGLAKPHKGKIVINGYVQKKNFLNKLSYYVSQKNFLLNDTIFKNIIMNNNLNKYEDLNTNQKNLFNKAIEYSGLREILTSKKNSFYFKIGEDGSYLSGGQRQRVSIARAIYSNRDLIILDESTSAMDKELEYEINKHLTNLTNMGKTIICISHHTYLEKNFKDHYCIKNKKIIKLK